MGSAASLAPADPGAQHRCLLLMVAEAPPGRAMGKVLMEVKVDL